MLKKRVVVFFILFCFTWNNISVFALDTKYPDYSYEFLGNDKLEKFNRKMFNFNLKLNKYAIRPIHTLWASVMPEYGMDRLHGITNNIEYPIRLISSLIQKDFKTSKNESIRFFTNTIIGLGGMFDPAKHIFKIEQSKENMEQALAGCNVKPGPYFVLPVLNFTNVRGLFGKILDMAFNPSTYVATPILAIVKAGLTVNRTSYLQPLLSMVESTYADPYDIAKKAFGIDSYIKCKNYDRGNIISSLSVQNSNTIAQNEEKQQTKNVAKEKNTPDKNLVSVEVSSEVVNSNMLYGGTYIDEINKNFGAENFKLDPDKKLFGYNPQNPIVDSMRTALMQMSCPEKSMWSELSIWNRNFSKRLKTDSVNIAENRENYHFKYLMQKEKNAPVAVIYPSIGEGINSGNSAIFGKIFYDAGYSVIIQGSHFQWEFVKSMPSDYRPGLPAKDCEAVKNVTAKIVKKLENKYNCNLKDITIIGTSFGAVITLFTGASEFRHNTLGNTKYIAICPPVDLVYAMKQVDKNSQEFDNSSNDLKERVALSAAKIVKIFQNKKDINFEVNNLPFSEEEGKLITGFLMHQKLSDLIFTIENSSNKTANSDNYKMINNMGYQDYAKKYLADKESKNFEDFSYEASLHSISNYLSNANNYKIYHSINDYLTNKTQLKQLKQYSGNKTVLFDNGAHLGFTYRKEFLEDLKNTIALK